MQGESLGAVSEAQELFEAGFGDDEIVAELRKRYLLDDHVALVAVRYARATSRSTAKTQRSLRGSRRRVDGSSGTSLKKFGGGAGDPSKPSSRCASRKKMHNKTTRGNE
jgi:hypothetical protein